MLYANDEVIVLNDTGNFYDLAGKTSIYMDDSEKEAFEDVIRNQFKAQEKNIYLPYYSGVVLWIKLSVKNTCTNRDNFIFELPNATIGQLTFYRPEKDGTYGAVTTGASLPFKTRELRTRHFSFEFNIPPGETRTFYFRIDPEDDSMYLPIHLWKPEAFINNAVQEIYLLGLYYGSILFIVIFHIFLYFNLRNKSLIFYMLSIIGFAGFQLSMDGFSSKYIFSFLPELAKRSLPIFVYLCTGATVAFLQLSLNTRKHIPSYHKILNFFKWASYILLSLCLISDSLFIYLLFLVNYFGPLSTLAILVGAILCYKRQPVLAKYFISAYIFLIIGVFLEVSKTIGLGEIAQYGIKIGHAGEAIILAFALAVRFKMIEKSTQALALERLQNLNELKDKYNAELEATVLKRTEQLETTNKSISDSIRYAQQIQNSMLPSSRILKELMAEHFILFKPKDIVSGDFYWFNKIDNLFFIAAVDCTGHGVPGAFMSILGSNLLKEIVTRYARLSPGLILEKLDQGVRNALKQNDQNVLAKDGMDLSMIIYNLESGILEFAGAKRPLFYFQEGSLSIMKGSNAAIGGSPDLINKGRKYTTAQKKVKKGDSIYLFSDGYADQFGGENNKKFMSSRFKDLLVKIQQQPMQEQCLILDTTFEQWKGTQVQVDDVLVIGIKFA